MTYPSLAVTNPNGCRTTLSTICSAGVTSHRPSANGCSPSLARPSTVCPAANVKGRPLQDAKVFAGRQLRLSSSQLLQRLPHEGRHSLTRRLSTARSGMDPPFDNTTELPLFPLPLVLFPGTVLPLQIFEYRYRMMMHTLLQTDLRVGILFSGKEGVAANVGCVGEIIKHERLVDDRFFLVCKGQERFRLRSIVRTKPYLVARVEWLEDKPAPEPENVDKLADEVEGLLKDVVRLTNKISGRKEEEKPDLRKKAFPTPFSFWVASTFEGAPVEQQAQLELLDTGERLRRQRDTLQNTLSYLSAATAVKDVFSSPSSETQP